MKGSLRSQERHPLHARFCASCSTLPAPSATFPAASLFASSFFALPYPTQLPSHCPQLWLSASTLCAASTTFVFASVYVDSALCAASLYDAAAAFFTESSLPRASEATLSASARAWESLSFPAAYHAPVSSITQQEVRNERTLAASYFTSPSRAAS